MQAHCTAAEASNTFKIFKFDFLKQFLESGGDLSASLSKKTKPSQLITKVSGKVVC